MEHLSAGPTEQSLSDISRQARELMVIYSRAIGASNSIPALSTSVLTLYFYFLLWLLCLDVVVLVGPIDLVLVIIRKLFRRPKVPARPEWVGAKFYSYLFRPFTRAWEGEIPMMRLFRVRYLTRLFLFYRTQSSISGLRRVRNRRYLEAIVSDPTSAARLQEEEKAFQLVDEVFQKITTDSYQISALALGGPIVALLSLFAQQALLPLIAYCWRYLGGPDLSTITIAQIKSFEGFFFLFGILTLCLVVSAWMDMRLILVKEGAIAIERLVQKRAGLRPKAEIPFDLLLYLAFLISMAFGFTVLLLDKPFPIPIDKIVFAEAGLYFLGFAAIGVIAGIRRYWLLWTS